MNEDFKSANIRRRARYTMVFIVLAVAFIVITILNINIGNVHIPVNRILGVLFTGQGLEDDVNIIWTIRMPRILMAAVLGGALSLAGFLLQTFFNNPIAGPFVLGISSGAKMVVALTMIVFASNLSYASSYVLIAAAFIGALISTGFILLVSRRINHMATLLVAGIMIGYICSAVTDFIVNFAQDSDIVNLHGWTQGSFSGTSWSNFWVALVFCGVVIILTLMMSKPIGAFQLGEAYAQSMGVNIKFFKVALIVLSSALSGCVTAFAGPISFVGIAVPFLVKQGLGTSRPIIVIPGVLFGGAVFVMFCDLIARTMFAPVELSISTVTSMFGAPIVIFMMMRKHKRGI